MKKIWLSCTLLCVLALLAFSGGIQAIELPFNLEIAAPDSGPAPDGYKLYTDCASVNDGAGRTLVTNVPLGASSLVIDVPNNATVNFCVTAFITDAQNNDNESPPLYADPLQIAILVIPGAPGTFRIEIDCLNLSEGLVCNGGGIVP